LKTPFDSEIQALLEMQYDTAHSGGFQEFIVSTSPELKKTNHLAPLISLIERSKTEEVRACISLPPRHGKTTTIRHGFAYLMKHNPILFHAYASYGRDFAKTESKSLRRLIKRCDIELEKGSRDVMEWHLEQGGRFTATSVSGGLTGKGITGLLVIDDPIKNRAEANSGIVRQTVWDFFTDVALTRMEKGSSVIIVHTRWHEGDLIGLLQKDFPDDWEFINIPAINEEGEALWPDAFPLPVLQKQQSVNPWSFEAMYQGNPRPKGDMLFGEPSRYELTPHKALQIAEGKRLVIAVDPAATEKTSADHSVALLLAKDKLGPDGKAWILDVKRAQTTIPKFVEIIRGMQEKWNCPVVVESVGGFKAVPQMLRSVDPGLRIKEFHPAVSKKIRAEPVAAAWNEGRVLLPHKSTWVDAFMDECNYFTGLQDQHDDQVDALAHAWNYFATMKTVRRGVKVGNGPFG